ncbi:MAG TPA: CRISPR-associated protein Cas5 [Verrucomicrobiae bacterium]|nr:CRISPR-associated protein Cas5 [Verrucomicrobiae bacterium]
MKIYRLLFPSRIAAFLPVVLAATQLHASIIWDESVNGDLSNDGSSPTALLLSGGVNAVLGTAGGTDKQDWVSVTVPTGFELSTLVLAAYSSTDVQGFIGVGMGPNFTNSVNSPSSYLGYSHFGTGAANGALAPTNLVGADILSIMGNNVVDSPGSQGFTPPLSQGTYTFLIQQLGASTTYEFDFGVTAVPEPSPSALAGLAAAICWTFTVFRRGCARR